MKRINVLKDRAGMLAKARQFFHDRNILEVDCPQITIAASVDAHIDLIPVHAAGHWRYLHSSPEYGMKRLLAEGIGDIYQLAHVFREGEKSDKHNPEFTMAEWYRVGYDFAQMIEETVDFIRLFVGKLPYRRISYREAFLQYAKIDYVHATFEELLDFIRTHDIPAYSALEQEDKDACLNLILGFLIEPQLGKEELCVLDYYPSTQAALAKKSQRADEQVAERFEVYYKGIELANGYHELTNAQEQRQRFIEANLHRRQLGKQMLPIDEYFLQALEKGLPDCCGVAVGFDRLMMLRHEASIDEVLPFAWDKA